jgi:hypothetical protein
LFWWWTFTLTTKYILNQLNLIAATVIYYDILIFG